MASDLSEKWPRDYVWETSHTKGHRFAPATMLLPGNYSYGRNAVNSASEILEYAQRGELWLQGNRGRGVWDGATGRRWLVELESRPSVMAKGSCGDKPKRASSWVVLDVQEVLESGR